MPKYRVINTIEHTEELEVDAANEKEAEEIANSSMSDFERCHDDTWTEQSIIEI